MKNTEPINKYLILIIPAMILSSMFYLFQTGKPFYLISDYHNNLLKNSESKITPTVIKRNRKFEIFRQSFINGMVYEK